MKKQNWTLRKMCGALPVFALGMLNANSFTAAPSVYQSVDNKPWQEFLDRYLDTSNADGIYRVRYASVTTQDRAALEAYLRTLQGVKVSALKRPEQMAFWINLYNAATVSVVLRHSPVKSVREISPEGSGKPAGPWDAKLLRVEGRPLSLNDIENQILRPGWKDARVHFALNCASLGCPNLSPQAYTAANLEAQLNRGIRVFLQSPRGLSWRGRVLTLSSLFDWYQKDFTASNRSLLDFLAEYAPSGLKDSLRAYAGKIEYQYDWNLNGI